MDDLLVIFSNPHSLTAQINLIQKLFQALGLVINQNKSHMVPTQEIEAPFVISNYDHISPSGKIKKVKQEVICLLQRPSVSVLHWAAFVGMTTATRQAIPVAPLFHC